MTLRAAVSAGQILSVRDRAGDPAFRHQRGIVTRIEGKVLRAHRLQCSRNEGRSIRMVGQAHAHKGQSGACSD